MIKTFLSQFCDLVLGPEPNAQRTGSIPSDFFFGKMIEIIEEQEDAQRYMEWLVEKYHHMNKAIALLGAEPSRWQKKSSENKTLLVMPGETASQILYAAHTLINSGAIDLIIIQEIFLKTDQIRFVMDELKKLRTLIVGSNVAIVLVNPNSTERKLVAGELQTICSRQPVCAPEWKKRTRD